MDKILDVMEDIKQKITDNEYKIIMDSLKEIHKNKEDNDQGRTARAEDERWTRRLTFNLHCPPRPEIGSESRVRTRAAPAEALTRASV